MKHVILASYGNDSIALIQWARENSLEDVTVLYNDTGWNRSDWPARVARCEDWVRSIGFVPDHTVSIGLEALVRQRKGWPRQGIQFCTEVLKIKPTIEWLDKNDPGKQALCMVGVRREESLNRRDFPVMRDESP